MDKKQQFNITSHNQSGGITAGIVNIGSQQRGLNDASKVQILNLIPQNEKFSIIAPMMDVEASRFGAEIKEFLLKEKRILHEDLLVIPSPIPSGQQYQKDGEIHKIYIGHYPR